MEPQRQVETHRSFTRRVHDTLRTISTAGNRPREVRIIQIQPAIDRSRVWGNLHNLRFFDGPSSAWYMEMHDIIPTNVRLHRIRPVDTENCTQCERHVTLPHRMRGRKRDLGMDPQTGSAYTKNGPEADTHGLALSPLLQILAPPTPSGNFMVFGAYGWLSG
jgi:hypothetical protein